MKNYVDKDKLQEYTTKLITKLKLMFSSPLTASTAAEMTETTKVYVYVGSETGYTNGNWYYYNGSAWVSGGIYNAVAFETDDTLSESGEAADAKAVGDALAEKAALDAYIVKDASGSVASFDDGADNVPMKSLVIDIEPIQSGSGDPSPNNIRPITGWTGANVNHVWNSLIKPSSAKSETVNGVTIETDGSGEYYVHGTANGIGGVSFDIPEFIFPDDSSYSIYLNNFEVNADVRLYFYNGSTAIDFWTLGQENRVIPFPQSSLTGKTCNRLRIFINNAGEYNVKFIPLLHKASEKNLISIAFGQTVYGGTLGLVSGLLTIEGIIEDLSTKIWNLESGVANFRTRVTDYLLANGWNTDYTKIMSNCLVISNPSLAFANRADYSFTNLNENYYNFSIKTPTNAFVDLTAFTNWLANVDGNNTHAIIYIPLATPIEVQLTPQEVKSLLGDNNIWADTGDTMAEYRADSTLAYNKLVDAIISLGGNV